MAHDVFICHASENKAVATAICSVLEQHRIRCWIAPRDVLPGSDYAQSIVEAIASTRLTVLVFSGHSNHSPHVRREIERSVSHGIPILPFRVDDVVPSPALEYFISDAHWLDAMTPPLERHLEHLAETVRLLLDRQAGAQGTGAAAPTGSAPSPPEEPTASAVAPGAGATGPARQQNWRWVVAAAVAVVALVVAGVALFTRGGSPQTALPGGATATSPTSTATQAPPSVGETIEAVDTFYDPFAGTLDPTWTWLHEDHEAWRLESGQLLIDATDGAPIRNVLVRGLGWAGSSYSVFTTLHFAPKSNFQFAGIVMTGDSPQSDRLQFGRSFCDDSSAGCVGDGLYFDRVKGGEFVGGNHAVALPDGTGTVWLTVEINGSDAIAQYSLDDGATWLDVGTHVFDDGLTDAGLIAHQAPVPITAAFDDFTIARWPE
jgi:hypothetical protein